MNDAKATEEDANERRVAPRLRTLRSAQILLNNRFSTIDCVVRNVSVTGALLTVDSVVQLPPTFEIRIGEEGETKWAKLVYRREMFAGVHFLDAAEAGKAVKANPQPSASPTASGTDGVVSIERIVSSPLPAALRQNLAWNLFS